MALSGKVETSAWTADSGSTWKVVLNWTATQSIANNTSTISWNIKVSTDSGGYVVVSEIRAKIAGEEVYYRSHDNHTNGYNGTQIASGTKTITHNTDGTKSVSMSIEAGIYQWAINKSGSNTFTLDTIPRASSITSASNKTLGNACSIKWTPNASTFKYKVKFSLGSWSYTTPSFISPASTSEYTYDDYTLPLDVAKQLPNATTGTMTAYLYTYNSSGTQIGSTASKTFTVTVPSSIKPSISSVSAELVNSNSVINGWGVAVAGYTKVKVSASASGSYSSTISSFTISGGYSTTQNGTSLAYTGGVISSSGSKTFTVVAKDSRGRSSDSKSATAITFYAYSKPTVSSFTVARSSSNAKKVVVKANWTFSSVNSKNAATATLYYKKSSNTSWTTYGTIAKNTNVTLTNDFDETSSYNFKVVVTDSLSNSAQEEGFVSTIEVTMDFRAGGKGLGIGKIAESDNLEIAFDTIFMGNVYIQNDDGTKISLADYIRSLI